MGLLDKIFRKKEGKFIVKEDKIRSYEDFWKWFTANEKSLYQVLKIHKNIEADFLNILSSKLVELKEGFFFLAGMYDQNTAEIIFSPDGIVKNIVFVEDLVKAAPALTNWKFTALKPANDVENARIVIENYCFDSENLSFYSIEDKNYPDEVEIVVVHNDYNEDNLTIITNGTYLFLDSYLGELNSLTTIDNLRIIPKDQAEKELIPISKLKDYLIWREKEFIEKYTTSGYNTENDIYSSIQATLHNGLPLIAIINSTLLDWDGKASHPWILEVEIKYDGSNNNGMPNNTTYEILNQIEDEILLDLPDLEGNLNIGRQTADSLRSIYFACKDFRKPSKILHNFIKNHPSGLEITYDIYKDKYWQSFERLRPEV